MFRIDVLNQRLPFFSDKKKNIFLKGGLEKIGSKIFSLFCNFQIGDQNFNRFIDLVQNKPKYSTLKGKNIRLECQIQTIFRCDQKKVCRLKKYKICQKMSIDKEKKKSSGKCVQI